MIMVLNPFAYFRGIRVDSASLSGERMANVSVKGLCQLSSEGIGHFKGFAHKLKIQASVCAAQEKTAKSTFCSSQKVF